MFIWCFIVHDIYSNLLFVDALSPGNNWGWCPGGGEGAGCGPQEEFRACADVAITKEKRLSLEDLLDFAPVSNELEELEELDVLSSPDPVARSRREQNPWRPIITPPRPSLGPHPMSDSLTPPRPPSIESNLLERRVGGPYNQHKGVPAMRHSNKAEDVTQRRSSTSYQSVVWGPRRGRPVPHTLYRGVVKLRGRPARRSQVCYSRRWTGGYSYFSSSRGGSRGSWH